MGPSRRSKVWQLKKTMNRVSIYTPLQSIDKINRCKNNQITGMKH